jgi:predicted nucleotidyltransferase
MRRKLCKNKRDVCMDKVPIEIIEKIKNYIAELRKNNYPIKIAILYGSYAKGTFTEWSDIDVALVSEAFEGNRFWDKERIGKIKMKIDASISPLPYRPEDFDESDLFVKEIIKTGIRIV